MSQTILDDFYNKFKPSTQEQQEMYKLIHSLITSDKNLNMKTKIKNPPLHATLDVFIVYLKDAGMKDASKYLSLWSQTVKEENVSENGERAEKVLTTIGNIQTLFRSLGDRLAGRHNEQ